VGCELRAAASHLGRGCHSAGPVAVTFHLAPHELTAAQPLAPELLHAAAHHHGVRHGRIGQQLRVCSTSQHSGRHARFTTVCASSKERRTVAELSQGGGG
jgi:hypothetical protein